MVKHWSSSLTLNDSNDSNCSFVEVTEAGWNTQGFPSASCTLGQLVFAPLWLGKLIPPTKWALGQDDGGTHDLCVSSLVIPEKVASSACN